jgi:hypothetical protein
VVILATLFLGLGMQTPVRGSVSSTNQSGGVTASAISTLNYFSAPPVTEQERIIALERLKLTLAELATYRERPVDLGELTSIETVRTEKIARRLYIALSSFFDPTIESADNGKELLKFKRSYNILVRNQSIMERESTLYFGTQMQGKASYSWSTMFKYCVLRVYRGSKEGVQASGLELFEISWDEAEALYAKFMSAEVGGGWLTKNKDEQEKLISTANILLMPYDNLRGTH